MNGPLYQRRNADGFYTYKGESYLSVTGYLKASTSEHLLHWTAKQAALKAASHLIQGGVVSVADIARMAENGILTAKEAEELTGFSTTLVDREISKADAVTEILKWATVMRESERYRDHKAAIGSVTHHAIYLRSMGGYSMSEITDQLASMAADVIHADLQRPGARTGVGPDFVPTDAMAARLAGLALPYVVSACKFLDLLEPEALAVGQEAMCVKPYGSIPEYPQVGYAGTLDAIFRLSRKKWEAAAKSLGLAPWEIVFGNDKETALQTWDFKTSNQMAVNFPVQVALYQHADVIVLTETQEEFPMTDTDGTAILHIGPDEELSGTKDEFGTLKSKAAHCGAQLHCYPNDGEAYQAGLSLIRYVLWTRQPTKPLKAPKRDVPERQPKTETRRAPF